MVKTLTAILIAIAISGCAVQSTSTTVVKETALFKNTEAFLAFKTATGSDVWGQEFKDPNSGVIYMWLFRNSWGSMVRIWDNPGASPIEIPEGEFRFEPVDGKHFKKNTQQDVTAWTNTTLYRIDQMERRTPLSSTGLTKQ